MPSGLMSSRLPVVQSMFKNGRFTLVSDGYEME